MRVTALFFDTPQARTPMVAQLHRGLSSMGWVPDRDVTLEALYAHGNEARLDELAREAVAAGCDALVAAGTLPAMAAQRATRDLPIVMVGVGDPVSRGLIASFEHPGGNVTGSSDQAEDAVLQRLGFLAKLLGRAPCVGIVGAMRLVDPGSYEVVARPRGWELRFIDVPAGQAIVQVLEQAPWDALDALFVIPSPVSFAARGPIAQLCLDRAVPLLFGWREFMDVPAAAGCGPNLTQLYGDVGPVLARLRNGERPGDIAAVRPTFQRWLRPAVWRGFGHDLDRTVTQEADELLDD